MVSGRGCKRSDPDAEWLFARSLTVLSPDETRWVYDGSFGGLFVAHTFDASKPVVRLVQAPWSGTSPPAWRPLPMGRIQSPDGLRVRDQPSLNGAIVGRLADGTRIEITATSDDGQWLRVRAEDEERGWVSTEFVVR